MIVMLLFAVSTFMQVVEPAPAPDTAPPPATQPRTTSPAPQPSKLTVDQLPPPAQYGTYLYDVMGVAVVKGADGGTQLVSSIWSLPGFLSASRLPENTVDQPDAAQLNQQLVQLAAGLMLVAMLLVVGYRILSVLRGELPNPMVMVGALTTVAIAGLAAVSNRDLQRFPIDLVNLLLQTISGAPIQQFVNPAFHVADAGDMLWNGLLLIGLVIVVLGLTVVLFIEGAWCVVLGALVGLAAFGIVLPVFGAGCRYLLMRWIGSLFSPIVALTAIRLAAPSTAQLIGGGAPVQGVQLAVLAYLFVAWQAPGLMVGAISVSFPSAASAYWMGRLVSFGRISESMIPRPGATSQGSTTPGVRDNPPHQLRGGFGAGTGRNAGHKWTPNQGES